MDTNNVMEYKVCECQKNSCHAHWAEWNGNFAGFNNVRIVPQEKQWKGPERRFVHYPLARQIAQGRLSEMDAVEFGSFRKGTVLVLCNLKVPVPEKLCRDWTDKRPDIIALSSSGDIIVIECKDLLRQNYPLEIEKDLKSFISVNDLAANLPISVGGTLLGNFRDKIEVLYNTRYPRHLHFPDFKTTLSSLFHFNSETKIDSWANKLLNCIESKKIRYGFAFNRSSNQQRHPYLGWFRRRFVELLGEDRNLIFFMVSHDGSIDIEKAYHMNKSIDAVSDRKATNGIMGKNLVISDGDLITKTTMLHLVLDGTICRPSTIDGTPERGNRFWRKIGECQDFRYFKRMSHDLGYSCCSKCINRLEKEGYPQM